MALHPEIQALLETPMADMLFNLKDNYPQIRAMSEAMKVPVEYLPPIDAVEARTIPGPAGDIPVRIYTPSGTAPFPTLMFFHGGGFVLGGLDMHEATCRNLANASGYKIVSVDYRLAPEHPFPAAPDDCFAATQWVADNAAQLQVDPARLGVCGDSAGGNLATVVALMARDRGGPQLFKQVLVYPVTEYFSAAQNTPHASYAENAEGYFLTAEAMDHFWHLYLTNTADQRSVYASPLRAADLSKLPPALVITAEYDPLRDEGESYAQRLREAGVAVESRRFDGMIHGFWGLTEPLAQPATKMIAEFLRK